MPLGTQLIDELARRRELGMYFDYAGYRRLRRIESDCDLRGFLSERGYPSLEQIGDISQVADLLRTSPQPALGWMLLLSMPLEAILGSLLVFPFWLLTLSISFVTYCGHHRRK